MSLTDGDNPDDTLYGRSDSALALEQTLHEEHRRTLASLLDLPPDSDWLRVARRMAQVVASRETWRSTAQEIERDRDERVAALEAEVKRLGAQYAEAVVTAEQLNERVRKTRKTTQRLNFRAQTAESRLFKITQAVAHWEIRSSGGTYVPLHTLAAIAKAVGIRLDTSRWELTYERLAKLEADVAAFHEGEGEVREIRDAQRGGV